MLFAGSSAGQAQMTTKQTQIFENLTEDDMIVWVELSRARFVLHPKDVMEITYDHDGDGYGMYSKLHGAEMQIYLRDFKSAVVNVNGKRVEPS